MNKDDFRTAAGDSIRQAKSKVDEFKNVLQGDSMNKDGLHTAVGDSIRQAGHKIDKFSETAAKTTDEYIHKGQDAAMDLKKEAEVYGDSAVKYIKENPVKATLIAAGIGMLLSRLLRD